MTTPRHLANLPPAHQAAIKQAVALAPPLTEEQITRIAAILRSGVANLPSEGAWPAIQSRAQVLMAGGNGAPG